MMKRNFVPRLEALECRWCPTAPGLGQSPIVLMTSPTLTAVVNPPPDSVTGTPLPTQAAQALWASGPPGR